MIKIENTETYGWEAALRGMRNPLASHSKSDSEYIRTEDGHIARFDVGENDLKLAKRLAGAGNDHGKFLRMIGVTCDITAPLYLWKEADTYKVGTTANSYSTMHKIHAKEFTFDDFSCEHVGDVPNCDPLYSESLRTTIAALNEARHCYLDTKDKDYWWQMIQLLPTSYNQKRTVSMNYAVLRNMYHARKNHKLDEWRTFCEWIESLPYSELITGETHERKREDPKTD